MSTSSRNSPRARIRIRKAEHEVLVGQDVDAVDLGGRETELGDLLSLRVGEGRGVHDHCRRGGEGS